MAPANPAGQALLKQLTTMGIKAVGLFDNLKTGPHITSQKENCQANAVVIVCEGPFQNDICLGLLDRGFHAQEILCQQAEKLQRFRYSYPLRWQQTCKSIMQKFVKLCLWLLPQRKHIYYTENFIDTNLLLAWRQHEKLYPGEALLLAKNLQQLPHDLHHLKGVIAHSPKQIFWHLVTAKSLILDHEFHGLVFNLVRQQRPTIQMFHGLPLKHLAGNQHFAHINDLHFVSSSAWFNQHVFSKIFSAQYFHAFGYPRNDALLQTASERDWVAAPPLKKLNEIIATTGQIIVYMPTYRDNGSNNYPIDYERIEKLCKQHNRSFILKFHPFVAEQLARSLGLTKAITQPTLLPGFEHIYIFPTGFNIYPWLAETQLLITDYSSVLFDFLALERPILLYQYDSESYLTNRGQFMISQDEFQLGTQLTSFEQLEQSLLHYITNKAPPENWQQHTQAQLSLVTQGASQAIVQLVRQVK